jgi:hypothetical protein
MENFINITKESESKFTSFKFYNRLLKDVALYYKENQYYQETKNPPDFSFFEKSFIDPITLPLIITLGEYLKKFHEKISPQNSKIKLCLDNDLYNNDILKFLNSSDFFKIVGNEHKYRRNIFTYDPRMLGAFTNKKIQNPDHKVRGYSLNDDDILINLVNIEDYEDKRDFLIQYFTHIVNDHFKELLNSTYAIQHKNEFIDILSELITNGLIHSYSDAYAMMFTNQYKTTFSISDCGRGLYDTISTKPDDKFYKSLILFNILKQNKYCKINEAFEKSAYSIFETLYFSTLKHRRGLIDLIINVVNKYNGTFRLHNVNVQIIVSSRMYNEIEPIITLREDILDLWNKKKFKMIEQKDFEKEMIEKSELAFNLFVVLAESIFKKYSEDIKFSSIRFFNINFNGVHIEAEIPQKN